MLKVVCNPTFVLHVISILWAMNFIMAKLALKYISPLLLVFIRIFTVSILFILLYNIFGIPKNIKHTFNKIFILSTLGITANQCCFMIGLNYTKPEHSALSISFIPLFTHVVAYLLKVEQFSRKTILCLLLATTGFFIIHLNNNIASKIFIGDIITLAGALFFAIYMVLFKVYNINMNSFEVSSLTYIFSAPVVFALAIPYFYEIPSVLKPEVILPLLYIVIFASVIAYILHMGVIRKVGVTKVSLYTFTQPIWATLFSLIFFEKSLTFNFIVGGSLIILSIIILEI